MPSKDDDFLADALGVKPMPTTITVRQPKAPSTVLTSDEKKETS